MKKALLVSAAIGIPMLLLARCMSSNTAVSAPSTRSAASAPVVAASSTERTPEQDLALADSAGTATPYAALLDNVERKCLESRRDLADLTAKAVEVTRKEGVKTNNLNVLTGASKVVAEYDRRQNCREVYTSLALAMIGNKNQ